MSEQAKQDARSMFLLREQLEEMIEQRDTALMRIRRLENTEAWLNDKLTATEGALRDRTEELREAEERYDELLDSIGGVSPG